jgi:hypothetical protein
MNHIKAILATILTVIGVPLVFFIALALLFKFGIIILGLVAVVVPSYICYTMWLDHFKRKSNAKNGN